MQAYMKRVVEEKEQLDERIVKITAFLSTDIYKRLPADEQLRISQQRELMYQYSDVLGQRVEYHNSIAHKCPKCGSPDPARHPAVQHEGEVQICTHEFHKPTT